MQKDPKHSKQVSVEEEQDYKIHCFSHKNNMWTNNCNTQLAESAVRSQQSRYC